MKEILSIFLNQMRHPDCNCCSPTNVAFRFVDEETKREVYPSVKFIWDDYEVTLYISFSVAEIFMRPNSFGVTPYQILLRNFPKLKIEFIEQSADLSISIFKKDHK